MIAAIPKAIQEDIALPRRKILSSFSNLFSRSSREVIGPGGEDSEASVDRLVEENVQLKRAVEELSILNELARAIGASLNSQDIVEKIVLRSVRALNVEQAVITLVDRRTDDQMKTLIRAMRTSSSHEQFHLKRSLLGWMYIHKKPLLSNDPKNDVRIRGDAWEESIRSLLCVPLMIKSELIGVLTVYNKKGGAKFTEEDQRLLAIIAGQSAQVIENARLYEEEKAYAHMQEEIRLARQIQLDLLPKSPPEFPGYDIAGISLPAQQVGGDYFDFVPMGEDQVAVCLGDVSGKGLPASLLMANLQATLRAQTLTTAATCERLMHANRLLYRSTDPEKFATLFYGILDARKNKLCFCNAGHENPILFSASGKLERLTTGGLVLGIMDDFRFQEKMVSLNPGDMLVIFSDGVTEAMNDKEELFGEQRLIDIVREGRKYRSADLIDRIVGSVKQHAGDVPQVDDITLVVVRRLEGEPAE